MVPPDGLVIWLSSHRVLDTDLKSKQADVDRIFEDQQRLRENMKALKGTHEEKAVTQQYTKELASQESQLGALRTEISDLQTRQKQGQQELDAAKVSTFQSHLRRSGKPVIRMVRRTSSPTAILRFSLATLRRTIPYPKPVARAESPKDQPRPCSDGAWACHR